MAKTDKELTPMMQQYKKIKAQHPDYILFYRLGDFYEMFFEDAKTVSEELELVLTGRDCGQEERAPMCGVPYHSCEAYIARLIQKGYKVAVCEQTEDPALAKGLVKREVVRMITPGTVMENSMLDETKNNYICAVHVLNNDFGIAFADISTGEIYATCASGKDIDNLIENELGRFSPTEILLSPGAEKRRELLSFIGERLETHVEFRSEEMFEYDMALNILSEQFGQRDTDMLRPESMRECAAALGGLIEYLRDTQKNGLAHIRKFNIYGQGQFMELDWAARRNLELTETMRHKEKKGSLLGVIDYTKTAMGGRLLRKYLEKPLTDVVTIRKRQNATDEMFRNVVLRADIRESLKNVFDMERLIGRIVYGTANSRDLKALSQTMANIPAIKKQLSGCQSAFLKEQFNNLDNLEDVCSLIESAIDDDPPVSITEGGFIRSGYSKELDSIRDLVFGGRGTIAGIEAREREETGIKSLKIGYNKVFGYYIEVRNSSTENVPDRYIRKQTLVNCERYITQELKDLEDAVLSAQEKMNGLEYKLFCDIREKISEQVNRIQSTAHAVAAIDVIQSFAEAATIHSYVMPEVDISDKITIVDGRHPVVEAVLKDEPFVPNDTNLDCGESRVAVITGPNMAGKSTYMRQVALIVILAQMGSFVPAKSATIGIVDKVFTRVGASDDLSSGKSTFMLEMSEVADILKNATPKSLLILDEIGRGTSTFDGMSVARAVLEYAANPKKLGARTLFATHYHELTVLEGKVPGVKNYNIAAKKRGDSIIFLRKIVRGSSDDSYGIEVAKLAGIPDNIIKRAREVLNELECGEMESKGIGEIPERFVSEGDGVQTAMDFYTGQIIDQLSEIDTNTITPIEAMNIMYQLCQKAKEIKD